MPLKNRRRSLQVARRERLESARGRLKAAPASISISEIALTIRAGFHPRAGKIGPDGTGRNLEKLCRLGSRALK
jgi:hypothetical protein